MNCQKIYDALISKAHNRSLIGVSEKHHVIPRCMGGSDEANNLVALTPEEHYLAHQLLVKVHPKHRGIAKAAMMMCVGRSNNKIYGWLRRRYAMHQSRLMSSIENPFLGKRYIANETGILFLSADDAVALVSTGQYIFGKKAVRAKCGCLVKRRCIKHENKKVKCMQIELQNS